MRCLTLTFVLCLVIACRQKPVMPPAAAEADDTLSTLLITGDTFSIYRPRNFPDRRTLKINGHINFTTSLSALRAEFGRPDSIRDVAIPCDSTGTKTMPMCFYGDSRFFMPGPDSLEFHKAHLAGIRIFLKTGSFIFNKDTHRRALQGFLGIRDTLPANGVVEVSHPAYPYYWSMRLENQRIKDISLHYPCGKSVYRKN
jgi:hypothetical protein